MDQYLNFKLNVHNNAIVRYLGHTSARDTQKRINKDSWSHRQLVSKYYLSQPNGAIQDFQGEGEPAWYPQLLDQHELQIYIYIYIVNK